MSDDPKYRTLYKITHDLKSPLMGIKVALHNPSELPEDTVKILQSVLSRLELIDGQMEQFLEDVTKQNQH